MSETTPQLTRAESARPKISAIVTTFNEAHNIGDCLESLLWCDEILVVDSFSTDRTKEIVESYPEVRFLEHTYYGSAAQKNWAMDRASHDWILIFDADERCLPGLQDEILALLASGPEHGSYTIRRRLYYLDRRIRFCGWHRDTVVRLVKKGQARYPNRRVHADMITSGPAPLLKNPLDHFMVYDPAEYIRRITKYGVWGAAQLWREGRSAGVIEIGFRPAWRFLRAYFVQLGFLDGLAGFFFCLMQAYGTFVKYSLVWSWSIVKSLGREPELPEFDESEETWALENETEAEAKP